MTSEISFKEIRPAAKLLAKKTTSLVYTEILLLFFFAAGFVYAHEEGDMTVGTLVDKLNNDPYTVSKAIAYATIYLLLCLAIVFCLELCRNEGSYFYGHPFIYCFDALFIGFWSQAYAWKCPWNITINGETFCGRLVDAYVTGAIICFALCYVFNMMLLDIKEQHHPLIEEIRNKSLLEKYKNAYLEYRNVLIFDPETGLYQEAHPSVHGLTGQGMSFSIEDVYERMKREGSAGYAVVNRNNLGKDYLVAEELGLSSSDRIGSAALAFYSPDYIQNPDAESVEEEKVKELTIGKFLLPEFLILSLATSFILMVTITNDPVWIPDDPIAEIGHYNMLKEMFFPALVTGTIFSLLVTLITWLIDIVAKKVRQSRKENSDEHDK